MASLEASLLMWPQGDASKEIRIKMPNQVTTANSRKCPGIQSSPLLVILWSSFQLCFYVSKVKPKPGNTAIGLSYSFLLFFLKHDSCVHQSGNNWETDQIAFVFNTSDVPLGSAPSNSIFPPLVASAAARWRGRSNCTVQLLISIDD